MPAWGRRIRHGFNLYTAKLRVMSANSVAPGARQKCFAAYLDRLAQAAGHLDRIVPLKPYCAARPPVSREPTAMSRAAQKFLLSLLIWLLCSKTAENHPRTIFNNTLGWLNQ